MNKSYELKIKIPCVLLFLAIFVSMSFFNFLDSDNIRVLGISLTSIYTGGLALLGILFWVAMAHLPNPKFIFGKWLLFFPVMVILSALQSWLLLGQNFIYGLTPQKITVLWALLYFPLYKAYYYGYFTIKDFKTMITVIGSVLLFLFILNFFVNGQLLVIGTSVRNGSTRYYYNPVMLDLLFTVSLDEFVASKRMKQKITSLIRIALVLFEVMIVQQFRLTSVALIMSLAFFIFMTKTNYTVKIIYLIIGFAALIFLFNTPLVQDVLQLVFQDPDAPLKSIFDAVFKGSSTHNLSIRAEARAWYLNVWRNHPLLGGGQPSIHYELSQIASGLDRKYYLVDVGIFGWIYLYGGIGVVWVISFWWKLLNVGWKLFKKNQGLQYLLFPLFFVFSCVNELHWFWQNGFVTLCLFLLIDTAKYTEITGEKNNSFKEQMEQL